MKLYPMCERRPCYSFHLSWTLFSFKPSDQGDTLLSGDSAAIVKKWKQFLTAGCLKSFRTSSGWNCGDVVVIDFKKTGMIISSGVYNEKSSSVVVFVERDNLVTTVSKKRIKRSPPPKTQKERERDHKYNSK